jgi:hypothetical protein
VAQNILARLDPDGRVGIIARYYIVRSDFRRATFRGIVIAAGLPLPDWAQSTRLAASVNRAFVLDHRAEYNEDRRQRRAACAG